MFEFHLGDLQLHGPGITNFSVNKPIAGLEAAEYRISSYDKPGEDGGEVSDAKYGMHLATLIGKVSGSNAEQYEENRLLLLRACAIRRDSNGYRVLTRCEVNTNAGRRYFFYAQVGKPDFPLEEINWGKFVLPLTIPGGIHGITEVSSGTVPLPQATGVTFPVTFPVVFGGVTGGRVTVTNEGTLSSWPVIRLDGPLTNPYLLNVTTGKILQLNYALPAGQFIKIYMGDTQHGIGKRVMLNDTDSLLAARSSDSDWWKLQPGENVIAFSSGSTGDSGSMSLAFNPGYVGI